MHKKYNKYCKRDSLYKVSSHKRTHVKKTSRKENADSLNELIKVPQNSKCDIMNNCGDIQNIENLKSRQRHKDRSKHRKSDRNKLTEHHSKKLQKQSNNNIDKTKNLLFQSVRQVKHKENFSKKEKRDKERLNTIEKYLEGLNDISHKDRGRNRSSITLRSNGDFESRKRHIRREKTFHGEVLRKKDSSESYPVFSEMKRLRDQRYKEKEVKKQKHRESKERDSNKERETNIKQLLYCQVDNPLEAFDKNRGGEKLSPHKSHKRNSPNKMRRRSVSKGRSKLPRGDDMKMMRSERSRNRSENSKERKTSEQTTHSQRKTKRKDSHKSNNEPKIKVNLGPYDKYFVVEKKSETEDDNNQQVTRRHGKKKESFKETKNDNVTKEERKQKKKYPEKRTYKFKIKESTPAASPDQFREKIEDDIKSYFTKIQTLIDKKLEFILHGSKETNKITDNVREDSPGATHSKKRPNSKEEKHLRHRSKSMKKHRSRKHNSIENHQVRRSHKSHTSISKEEKNIPSEEFKTTGHRKSFSKSYVGNNTTKHLESNEKESLHHTRHNSPQHHFNEAVLTNRLYNMIENSPTYSLKAKKSCSGDKVAAKETNSEVKLRSKHSHKLTSKDHNQSRSHRASSLARRKIGPEELMCAGIANDFCLGSKENHIKINKRRPLNLECKTVSIIGIPSQIKDSTIFNETQTTNSLNAVNSMEDPVERKKKTKRFKLYYKYNSAKSDSEDSSDGKSIVSDSYRVVSGNSEHTSEVCLERVEREHTLNESRKIVFVMKRESLANISGDTKNNQIAIEHFSKNCRKQRAVTPIASKLKNIVEEPSNMSCFEELDKTVKSINGDFHCKYFNILNSSSSACNLHMLKKSTVSDWNIPVGRCKCRIFDNSDKLTAVQVFGKKTREKDGLLENRLVKNVCNQRNEKTKKIKHRKARDGGEKYTSKSDINISYGSLELADHKLNKKKRRINLSSHLIENSNYTPSDAYVVRNNGGCSDKDGFPINIVQADRTELELKESVCQTESESYKDALEELMCSRAYKKYFAEMVELHHTNKQDVKSKDPDMITEAKILQPRKKDSYLEVTRIPSLLSRKRVEKSTHTPIEINISEMEINENIPQKHSKSNGVPETTNASLKSNQKKSVDIGVEVAIPDEKLRKREENSPKQNKSSLKLADPVVNVNVNTLRRNFNNGVGRNEKLTRLVETTKPPTLRQNSQINRAPLTMRSLSPQSNKAPSQQSNRSTSQQSKKTSSSVTKSVTLQTNPKVSVSILSARSKARQIERPFSARAKSANEKNLSQKPIVHAVKRSISAVDKITAASASDTKKINRIERRTKAKDVLVKKSNAGNNTSHLTVLDGQKSNKIQTEKRSNSCSFKSKPKSNFSFTNVNSGSERSKLTSLVCLNKFNYGTKVNLNSTSQGGSLDRYTTKSICDQSHSRRLFLTKDYSPSVNTYQRRKTYDESLRRKMKRHCRFQDVIAPQVFEVRYLSLEKETLNDGSLATTRSATANSSQISHLNKFHSNPRKIMSPRTIRPKKGKKHIRTSKENVIKFSDRNPFKNVNQDVDSLNKSRKQVPKVKIEDIFIQDSKKAKAKHPIADNSHQQTATQSPLILTKDDATSFHNLKSLKRSSDKTEQNVNAEENFMHFIDLFCKTIVGYCNSATDLLEKDNHESPSENNAINNNKNQLTDMNILNDGETKHEARLSTAETQKRKEGPQEKLNEKESYLFSENSKYTAKQSNYLQKIPQRPLGFSQMSCPALAGTTSSFEFLYEDDSRELNKQAVLNNLTKPWDTILGYALHCNDTVIIRKEACTSMGNKLDEMSNSPTDSGESGYSTLSSKKCFSATSFFKKPSVAALLKPSPILEVGFPNGGSLKSLISSNRRLSTNRYNLMPKECQEYAQKDHAQSENTIRSEGTLQEIPLNVLLQRKTSTVLGQCNSDCSICKEYAEEKETFSSEIESEHVTKSVSHSRVLLEEDSFDTVEENENKLEMLIYYGNPRFKPSLEMVKRQTSKTNLADAAKCNIGDKELDGCPMVLSNTNLHKGSLTLIDLRQSKEHIEENDLMNSANIVDPANINSKTTCNELKASRNVCTEGALAGDTVKGNDETITDDEFDEAVNNTNTTSRIVSKYNISSPEAKKLMAKKFFENLLRVYEKEMAVTTRLFQDDDFFTNDLLTSVNVVEEKRKRKGNFKKIIKGKIRGYIDNVFTSKSIIETSPECGITTDQSIAEYKQFESLSQKNLKMLAYNARRYFSLFVQAVTANKDINDEIKICGLSKILQRIENGDFTILRTDEQCNFENEIKLQVKEAFVNIYEISVKEARKYKRSLSIDDLKLIKAFVSKYRIGLLSKTDIIATYIGRGIFKTEDDLSAAVTYLIRTQAQDVNLEEFEAYCKVCTTTKRKK